MSRDRIRSMRCANPDCMAPEHEIVTGPAQKARLLCDKCMGRTEDKGRYVKSPDNKFLEWLPWD